METKPIIKSVLKSKLNIETLPYNGLSCIANQRGDITRDVDITTIKDWTNIYIPYYSWNGDGIYYLFKIHPDHVDVDDITVWFPAENDNSVRYELIANDYMEDYNALVIAEIILNPEIQAIRQAVIHSLTQQS